MIFVIGSGLYFICLRRQTAIESNSWRYINLLLFSKMRLIIIHL